MKHLLLFPFLLFIFANTASACINELSVTAAGQQVVDARHIVPHGTDHAANKAEYEQKLKVHYDRWQQDGSLNAYSDYGVYLVYLGLYEEAKAVFQEIERAKPGQYATAANIGTVYELLGQNDSAFHWISEAVRINPTAHDSSEWLHVKILEAKIKGNDYITSDFLLGTSFGTEAQPNTALSNVQLDKLAKAIYYQLNERMSFIKPKEPIVALLLFELGNITSYTTSVENAIKNYGLAREYGYKSEVMDKRQAHFTKMHNKVADVPIAAPENSVSPSYLLIAVVIGIVIVAGVFGYRRFNRKDSVLP